MDSGVVSIERLREVASTRVEATSLRQVAREVRVTAMGLRYFLDGGEPRPATRRKLEEWFVGLFASEDREATDNWALTAFSLLERDLPASHRRNARAKAVAVYEGIYDSAGLPRPDWLREARRTVDAHPDV